MNSYIILIPVWGNKYIERCSKYVLSALLAKGNIPYLTSKVNVKIRFLTTKLSSQSIANNPICNSLEKFTDITYCLIDDLVNLGEYGLILTIAYERAIRIDSSEQQLSNCYIFLNGDFVLSNNTFQTLYTIIMSGYSAVIAPSLRVNEQYLQTELDRLRKSNAGIIDCSGRELMSYAISKLHPTVIASMINNPNIGSNICHQYFNLVNDTILIAKYFLLFMLCIKPERSMPLVTSHCDYSFVPELCPSGNYKVITNSDDALLMELAPIEQEAQHIYFSPRKLSADIQRIKSWATKEHIGYSKNTIFFHTNGIPQTTAESEELHQAQQELDRTMFVIYEALVNSSPVSHNFHHFWNNQVNILKNQGKLLDRESISRQYKFANSLHNLCFKKLLGIQPFVTKLHFKYQDYSNCISKLDYITKNKALKILYVCGNRKDFFTNYFSSLPESQTDLVSIDELNNIAILKEYDLIFAECNSNSFARFTQYVTSQSDFNINKVIIFIDLITSSLQDNNISAPLCALHSRAKVNKIYVPNAAHKWRYYLSAVKFMNELYGNRRPLVIIYNLLIFAYSALIITINNIFVKNTNSNSDLNKISSVILTF